MIAVNVARWAYFADITAFLSVFNQQTDNIMLGILIVLASYKCNIELARKPLLEATRCICAENEKPWAA